MTNPSNTKFETRVTILAATLLCEMGRVQDPRLAGIIKPPVILRPLTFAEAVVILEDYGIRHGV